jgi:hypothetical protein
MMKLKRTEKGGDSMLCSLASLDKEKVEAIQSLEKKLGKTVLAFSCKEMKIDTLKDDEIAQIREAEGRLGLSLVAVK